MTHQIKIIVKRVESVDIGRGSISIKSCYIIMKIKQWSKSGELPILVMAKIFYQYKIMLPNNECEIYIIELYHKY